MESSRLEQYQDAVLRDQKYRGKNGDDDHDDSGNDDVSLDELLEELGDDDGDEFMSRYREQRLQEMSDALKQIKKNVQEEEYGMVQTMLDENALMRLTTEKERIVIHFFLPSFKKCQVMDKSLDKLACREAFDDQIPENKRRRLSFSSDQIEHQSATMCYCVQTRS